jgi:hypothetical protein
MSEWCEIIEIFSLIFHKHYETPSKTEYKDGVVAELHHRNYTAIPDKKIFRSDGGFSELEIGRIDLEVEQRLLFEFKIHRASTANVRQDKAKLGKYLRAYRDSGVMIERAAIVYFSNSEIRVVEVEIHD